MEEKRIKEIIKQVLHKPQVAHPVISYKITDVNNLSDDRDSDYTSEYIDKADFDYFLKRLESQLVYRLKNK